MLPHAHEHGQDDLVSRARREGRADWIEMYEGVLLGSSVRMVDFDAAAARIYAELRAELKVKAPDAIQLACAAAAKTDLFITNDDRLTRLVVPGIQFITSLERVWL